MLRDWLQPNWRRDRQFDSFAVVANGGCRHRWVCDGSTGIDGGEPTWPDQRQCLQGAEHDQCRQRHDGTLSNEPARCHRTEPRRPRRGASSLPGDEQSCRQNARACALSWCEGPGCQKPRAPPCLSPPELRFSRRARLSRTRQLVRKRSLTDWKSNWTAQAGHFRLRTSRRFCMHSRQKACMHLEMIASLSLVRHSVHLTLLR